MEKQLKCVKLLSLQEMALRRVVVTLWSGSDILFYLWEFLLLNISDEEWQEAIENRVKDEIFKLELPKSLTKQMIDIVRPISLELIAWGKKHPSDIFPDSTRLCWTTSGTINYRKTAEELLHCDELDVKQRYEIACYYCLEDSISLYWEKLPEEEKRHYGNHKSLRLGLPHYWSYIVKGERSELDYLVRISGRNLTTINQWAFENAASKGCKTATEYFFKKLTQEERETSLMRTVHAVMVDCDMFFFVMKPLTDLACYLLTVMSPEQQMETIKAYPIRVFSFFLRWPLQDLFLDNAGLLWTFLPASEYTSLINKILNLYKRSFLHFPKIFEGFFMESPQDFKKWFLYEKSFGPTAASRFLSAFFHSGDSESIEVMFRNLDAADRAKLVSQRSVLSLFYHFMRKDRWDLVRVCLRVAALTKEKKERLKGAFTRYLKKSGRARFENRRCKPFFEFLDETDASSDKRMTIQKRKLENSSSEQ